MHYAIRLTSVKSATGVRYEAVTDALLPLVDALESFFDPEITMLRSMNTGEMVPFRRVMKGPYDSDEYGGHNVLFAHNHKGETVAFRINMGHDFLRRVEFADPTSGVLEWRPLIWEGYTQLVLPTQFLEKVFKAQFD